MKNWIVIVAIGISALSHAEDRGFRFIEGKCKNEKGKRGYNPRHLGQCGDWSDYESSRKDFSNLDLKGSRFENAKLPLSDFSGSNLEGSKLKGAVLHGSDFYQSNLTDSDFTNAQLNNVILSEVKAEYADFSKASISKSDLTFGFFRSAVFRESNLANSDFESASLQNAELKYARAIRTKFIKADLTGASFSYSKLHSANFFQSKLADNSWDKATISRGTFIPYTRDELKDLGFQINRAFVYHNTAHLAKIDKNIASYHHIKRILTEEKAEVEYIRNLNSSFFEENDEYTVFVMPLMKKNPESFLSKKTREQLRNAIYKGMTLMVFSKGNEGQFNTLIKSLFSFDYSLWYTGGSTVISPRPKSIEKTIYSGMDFQEFDSCPGRHNAFEYKGTNETLIPIMGDVFQHFPTAEIKVGEGRLIFNGWTVDPAAKCKNEKDWKKLLLGAVQAFSF